MQTRGMHLKQKEQSGECMPASEQVPDNTCFNDQPTKGT